MTTKFFLDPKRVGELEPSEGDESSKAMLSPFAVPQSILIDHVGTSAVARIRFQYSVTEMTAAPELLDEERLSAVTVHTSLPSQKVLELTFDPPTTHAELRRIAERLAVRAQGIQSKAKKLSYRMASSILAELIYPVLMQHG